MSILEIARTMPRQPWHRSDGASSTIVSTMRFCVIEKRTKQYRTTKSYTEYIHPVTFPSFSRFSRPCLFLVSSSKCRRRAHRCDIRKCVIEREKERETRLNKQHRRDAPREILTTSRSDYIAIASFPWLTTPLLLP